MDRICLAVLIWFPAICLNLVTCIDIRLVPGPSEGRVEVFYNDTWGTICHDYFDNMDATVICRSINQPFKNAYEKQRSFVDDGSGQIWLNRLECTGRETDLEDCNHGDWGETSDCYHYEDVGIVCTNETQNVSFAYGSDILQPNSVWKTHELSSAPRCIVGGGEADGFTRYTRGAKRSTFSNLYSLRRDESGNMTCVISNWDWPNQDSVSIFLDVLYPPHLYVESTMSVFEHTPVNVSITNVCNPLPEKVTWRQAGTQIKMAGKPYRIYDNISRHDTAEFVVNITTSMMDSNGVVRNASGIELILLSVLYPPTINCTKQNFALPGSSITVTCSVDSNPVPHVFVWTNPAGIQVHEGTNSTLTLRDLQPSDSGEYICTAINKMVDYNGKTKNGVKASRFRISVVDELPQPSVTESVVSGDDTTSSVAAYVMYGVVAVAVVIIVILIVIVVKLKRENLERAKEHGANRDIRLQNDDNSEGCSTTQEHPYSGLVFPDDTTTKFD